MEVAESQFFTNPIDISFNFMRINWQKAMMFEVRECKLYTCFIIIIFLLEKLLHFNQFINDFDEFLTYAESCQLPYQLRDTLLYYNITLVDYWSH